MATVVYDDIYKKFGAVEVLKGVDFGIDDHLFAVLLGPSGCGKTTLLRMTAGLETITKGEISIGGRVVNSVHPRDRDIAMVFQNYALYPLMRVYDNIAFALQIQKKSAAEVKKQVHWAAEILNLTDYLHRFPRELSGGQRQRVAMGRALVRHPQVFLFDEPLSNLDAKLRTQMRAEIRQLHDRLKTTTVYVTHDQIEALTMADMIVVMKDGDTMQIGSPEEIYDRPANTFVADFIGSPSINLIEAVVESGDGAPVCRVDEHVLPLPADAKVKPGDRVIYGVRPVDIEFDPTSGALAVTSVLAEPTGAETLLIMRLADHELRVATPGRVRVAAGATTRVSIDAAKTHLFDVNSGRRIG